MTARLFLNQRNTRGHRPRLQPRGAGALVSYIRERYSDTNLTAIEPSPTAEATRFIEVARTSPAANMPGTVVSRSIGSRSSFHNFAKPSFTAASRPVKTKPFEFRMTEDGSQSLCGRVPINTNTASTGSTL